MHGSSMAQIKIIPMGGVWRSDEIVILCIQPLILLNGTEKEPFRFSSIT